MSKWFIHIVEYNRKFNFDKQNDIKFIDIDLLYNKLSVELLANNFNIELKKKYNIVNLNNKINKILKFKVMQKKKTLIKQIKKIIFKVSIFISVFVSYQSPNI